MLLDRSQSKCITGGEDPRGSKKKHAIISNTKSISFSIGISYTSFSNISN